jgi:hypothetical protein
VACRVEMIAMHVHGQEADLDAFFDDIEKTIEAKAEEASKLWPSLEFLSPVEASFDDEEEEDDTDGF